MTGVVNSKRKEIPWRQRALCKDVSILALIDDHPLDDFGVRDWTYIWLASPEKHRSSTWKKEMNAEVLYMDTWNWGEIVAPRYISFPPSESTRAI